MGASVLPVITSLTTFVLREVTRVRNAMIPLFELHATMATTWKMVVVMLDTTLAQYVLLILNDNNAKIPTHKLPNFTYTEPESFLTFLILMQRHV